MGERDKLSSFKMLAFHEVGSSASSTDDLLSSQDSLRGASSVASEAEDESHLAHACYSGKGNEDLANLCINAIRFLCIDAINHANSGHPGHGSMLLYAMLFLCGYQSTSMDDLKNFRKLGSRTPGHPECTETPGVEVCTGPLGQGVCNAVGAAIAEAHMASVYNRPGCPVVDNYTYCLVGDGCMMEGLSAEACSLAGHLQLGKLIVLYDDNSISIDGSTEIAFTEDVSMRFESYGWQVLHVKNGNTDISGIDSAIYEAKRCANKPTLIKITTTIGYGAPNKSDSAIVHGSALGKEETEAARKVLGYGYRPFEVPPSVLQHLRRKLYEGICHEYSWRVCLEEYDQLFPKLAKVIRDEVLCGVISPTLDVELCRAAMGNRAKSRATRKHSKTMLNTIAANFPGFIGGSADTSPSTLTDIECSGDFTAVNRNGRNIRFGVREHAMAAIANGIGLAGYNLRPFCSTFFVFSDYMRAAMRMASLSCTGTIFVTTHDSIAVGEDGPSHQPIEHLASFRAMPNHDVWRPADAVETGAAYSKAILARRCPSTIVLSRQSLPALERTDYEYAKRGGYVLAVGQECHMLDGIIVATGSEVALAIEAALRLRENFNVWARIVSLPCWEEFERQSVEYRKKVFCMNREHVLSVEAGSSFGWSRYADYHVSIDEFGRSGNGKEVLAEFGITVDNIVSKFLVMRAALQ